MIPQDGDFRIRLEPWMTRAKCKGRPIGEYDVDNLPSPMLAFGREHRLAAARLCDDCPVFGECAWYGYRVESTGCVIAGIPIKTQRNFEQFTRLLEIAAKAGIEEAREQLKKGAAA